MNAATEIEYRTLGRTGLRVSVLGFGASEIGWDKVNQREVDRILGPALDAGLNVIDTAACYFDSEEKIGVALADRPRDSYFLFTKCGHASGLPHADWTQELVTASIERSLSRLKTDHLDLVQLHSCSEETLRRGDVIDTLERAREAGKVRFVGYSGDGPKARYAIETGRFDTLQTSVSLADQEALELTLPRAEEQDIGVIAKRPLANVAWRIGRPPEDGHQDTILDQRGYGDEYKRRLAVLDYSFLKLPLQEAVSFALRFTISVANVHTAIVGSTRPGRWEHNASLLRDGSLPDDLMESIGRRWSEVGGSEWGGLE
ncbi:aldo/keto reductase [soil metagenome]